MKLLHIDCSILAQNSVSRELSRAVATKLGFAEVVYRDLVATPLSHLTGEHLSAAQGAVPESDAIRGDIAYGQLVLREFLDADTIVIGVPMYNFTIPSQLKAWIDRIVVAGQTFKYEATGPVGLAGSKKVILALARGGLYGPNSASALAEHAESYLKAIFAFIGITQFQTITAEGVQLGPDARKAAITAAMHSIGAL